MSNRVQDFAVSASLDEHGRVPLHPQPFSDSAENLDILEPPPAADDRARLFRGMTPAPDATHDYVIKPGPFANAKDLANAEVARDPDFGGKRLFDLAFSIILLIAALPLMVLLAVLIRVTSPGPAIFIQQRVGREGIMFPCLKFRTMVVDASERLEHLLRTDPVARAEWDRDQKLRNDVRVTAVGRFLRKTSLDELPQLLNIFVGHMSVVGPRPIVLLEVARYGVHFKDYCAVRPGLTGLWQIGGRNDVSYDTRVKLDVKYVQTRSLVGDIAICCRTLPALIQARGCY